MMNWFYFSVLLNIIFSLSAMIFIWHYLNNFSRVRKLLVDLAESFKLKVYVFKITKDAKSDTFIRVPVQFFNRSKGKLKKQYLSDCIPNSQEYGIPHVLTESLNKKQPVKIPILVVKDDQIHIWREYSIIPFTRNRVLLGEMDTTKYQRKVEQLRANKNLVDTFFNETPVPMIMINNEKEVLFYSKNWAELFFDGQKPESNIEQYRELETFQTSIDLALLGQHLQGQRKITDRQTGSELWVDWSVSPWRKYNKRISGVIIVLKDITKRRELQMQIQRSAIELAILNRNLLQKNQDLDDFTSIVGHDLKEPLRGIHAYSEMLIEESPKLNQEQEDYLHYIHKMARTMLVQLSTLQELSKLGKSKIQVERISLSHLCQSVIQSLRYLIEEKNAIIHIEALPSVNADSVRLREVFYNLINNAIKYNRQSQPQIWIKPCLGNKEKGFIVEDNGIGMKKEHLPSIFKVFKRLHAKDKYGGGTGAGLAIVKRIIEQHHGRIEVESEVGTGSQFKIFIPD